MQFVERQSRGYSRATTARWSPVAGGNQIWNTIFRDLTSHTALEMRMQSRRRLVAACRSMLLRACDRVASCEGGQRDQAVAIGSSRELPAATALSLSRSCEGLHLNQCSAIGRATKSPRVKGPITPVGWPVAVFPQARVLLLNFLLRRSFNYKYKYRSSVYLRNRSKTHTNTKKNMVGAT